MCEGGGFHTTRAMSRHNCSMMASAARWKGDDKKRDWYWRARSTCNSVRGLAFYHQVLMFCDIQRRALDVVVSARGEE